MTGVGPEFSRPVPLARLGAGPLQLEIAANEAERAALARRFDLPAIDRLSAAVTLSRRGRDGVLLQASFAAEFVQTCVVTLDPVPGTVEQSFALLYGPPDAEPEDSSAADDIAFEPLSAPAIDIGEAVAQEFSLALPPFPRGPGAAAPLEAPPDEEAGPFGALSRIAERPGR